MLCSMVFLVAEGKNFKPVMSTCIMNIWEKIAVFQVFVLEFKVERNLVGFVVMI